MRHLLEASQGRGPGQARQVVVSRDLRQPVGEQNPVDFALVDHNEGEEGLLVRECCTIIYLQSFKLHCG